MIRWLKRLFDRKPEPAIWARTYVPFAHTGSDRCTHCERPVHPQQGAFFVGERPVCLDCAKELRGQNGEAQ